MIKNTKVRKKGFTLTEVLVVVLIIGVMTAVAYPVYTKTITKSRAVEAINLLEMVRNKQIANFARSGEYSKDFAQMGKLTTDNTREQLGSDKAKLTVGRYELSINTDSSCMTAAYIPGRKKAATFTFSGSYEEAGLGCDGAICSSFGNIVGSSSSVCRCGDTQCKAGFTKDPKTCACNCTLACNDGNSCTNKIPPTKLAERCPNGGMKMRTCRPSCGTPDCDAWGPCVGGCALPCTQDGKCEAKTQKKPIQKDCANGGKQTRTCTPDCNGGTCEEWGECKGQSCADPKPETMRTCGTKCGVEQGTAICDPSKGSWVLVWSGVCSAGGECQSGASEPCGNGGTRHCLSTCGWGTCEDEFMCTIGKEQKRSCAGNPDKIQTRIFGANGTWGEWQGDCVVDLPKICIAGARLACGSCGTQICNSTGTIWSACTESPKPASSTVQCGNCGTKTQDYTCAMGTWTPSEGTCKNEGVCKPGSKELVACGRNTGYGQAGKEAISYREAYCTSACTFPAVKPCDQCTESPDCGRSFGGGQIGKCYCTAGGIDEVVLPLIDDSLQHTNITPGGSAGPTLIDTGKTDPTKKVEVVGKGWL